MIIVDCSLARLAVAALLCGAITVAAFACDSGGNASPSQAVEKAEDVSIAGKKLYMARCSVCHGDTGAGDGPGAAALDPKPRDLGDPTWQSSVTDEHIAAIIGQGGAAVGKSPGMPPAPDLAKDPAQLEALVRYIRSLGK